MWATLGRIFLAVSLTGIGTFCMPMGWAQKVASEDGASASATGILLLAHGGSKDWNANIQAIADEVNKTQPTEVALGMADKTTLQAGIDKLTARGVKRIVAVPLFVSSHSSVIEATKYLLNLRGDAPRELLDFAMDHDHGHGDSPASNEKTKDADWKTRPVSSSVPIQLSAALDRHHILAEILADRASAMSRNPAHEAVVLVAHGPNDDEENSLWLDDLSAVAKSIAAEKPFASIDVTTLRDDASPATRDAATQKLRSLVATANDKGLRVLIVPVLLSYGGIETGIRKRLDGLDHVMSPSGLLPDPRISTWILESSRSSSTSSDLHSFRERNLSPHPWAASLFAAPFSPKNSLHPNYTVKFHMDVILISYFRLDSNPPWSYKPRTHPEAQCP